MAWLRNKKTGGWFEIPDEELDTSKYMNEKIRGKNAPQYEKYETYMIDRKRTPIALTNEFNGAEGYKQTFEKGVSNILTDNKLDTTKKAEKLEKYLNDMAKYNLRKGWKVKAVESKPEIKHSLMSGKKETTVLFKATNPKLGYTIKIAGTNKIKEK